jgi:hypothetical protein
LGETKPATNQSSHEKNRERGTGKKTEDSPIGLFSDNVGWAEASFNPLGMDNSYLTPGASVTIQRVGRGKSYTPLNAGDPARAAHPIVGRRIRWARPISR